MKNFPVDPSLMPPSLLKGTLAFGSDHGGYELKEFLKNAVLNWDYTLIDCGTTSTEPVDYSDFIQPVVQEVLKGAYGVLICGSGIGMSIGANRVKGIRAALCTDAPLATLARAHNNANILVLGERIMDKKIALLCLEAFLKTPFEGGRHIARLNKLDKLG